MSLRSRLLFALLIVALPVFAQDRAAEVKTAFARAQHLRHGINASEWFAQTGNYSAAQTDSITDDADIALMAQIGFDNVRLSIDAAPLSRAFFGKDDTGFLDRLDHAVDQMHPDDQGRVIEGWLAMLATHRAQHTRLRRKRKDGSWMWVDTTMHNFLNEPGRNHVLVEIIDVSAEMSAQEALAEREELLRRLTDGLPDGLFQLDIDGNVTYHNTRLLEILHGSPAAGSVTSGEG